MLIGVVLLLEALSIVCKYLYWGARRHASCYQPEPFHPPTAYLLHYSNSLAISLLLYSPHPFTSFYTSTTPIILLIRKPLGIPLALCTSPTNTQNTYQSRHFLPIGQPNLPSVHRLLLPNSPCRSCEARSYALAASSSVS